MLSNGQTPINSHTVSSTHSQELQLSSLLSRFVLSNNHKLAPQCCIPLDMSRKSAVFLTRALSWSPQRSATNLLTGPSRGAAITMKAVTLDLQQTDLRFSNEDFQLSSSLIFSFEINRKSFCWVVSTNSPDTWTHGAQLGNAGLNAPCGHVPILAVCL